MTLREFLTNNGASFVKPTQKLTGLNFRNADNKIVCTVLTDNCPEDETGCFQFIRDHANFNVVEQAGSNIIRLSAPVDKGFEMAGLWDEPKQVSRKK